MLSRSRTYLYGIFWCGNLASVDAKTCLTCQLDERATPGMGGTMQ